MPVFTYPEIPEEICQIGAKRHDLNPMQVRVLVERRRGSRVTFLIATSEGLHWNQFPSTFHKSWRDIHRIELKNGSILVYHSATEAYIFDSEALGVTGGPDSEQKFQIQRVFEAMNSLKSGADKDGREQLELATGVDVDLVHIGGTSSKKAVIAVSGFLSGRDDPSTHWRALQKHFPDHERFVLKWDAGDIANLLLPRGAAAAALMFPQRLSGPVLAAAVAAQMLWVWKSKVRESEEAGRELAHNVLTKFEGKDVTLIGFSLGTRVVHGALKQLAAKNAGQVKNAVLLGGATSSTPENWSIASRAVENELVNGLTNADQVLHRFYRMAELTDLPIGVTLLQPAGRDVNNILLDNTFDYTLCSHLGYMSEMEKILAHIRKNSDLGV